MTLTDELKELIINSLDLEDISAEEIDASAPLFGEGLELDSIDALELGLAISKKYGVKIDADSENSRKHFASINSLAAFIEQQR